MNSIVYLLASFALTHWLTRALGLQSVTARVAAGVVVFMMLPAIFHSAVAAISFPAFDWSGTFAVVLLVSAIAVAGYVRFSVQRKKIFPPHSDTSPKRRIDRL